MYAWGSGYKDSRRGVVPPVLGLGAYEGHRTVPECVSTLPDSLRFTAIASGWDHCLAIDSNGKVLSWGSGQNGKLGHGRDDNVSVPTYIESLKDLNVISIATGCEHSAVVTDEGVVYSWGHGEGGRLGHGDNTTCPSPLPVQSLRVMGAKVSGLHCGDKFTVVLAKSEVVSSSAMSTSKAMSPETATVPSPFSERWFCNHLDADGTNIARILGPHPETESNNDAIQISGIQVSMMLLSLLTQATRTMDRRSRDLSQEGRYLPYVFERGNIYLGALLSLLETTSEKFYGIEKNLTDIEFPKVTDENFSFGDLLWQNSAEDIPSGILLLSKLLRNSCLLHNCLTLLAAALSAYDVEKATNGQILSGRKGSADRPLDRTIDEALSPFSPKQRLGQTQPRSLRNSREDSLGRSRSLRIEVSMGTREDEAAGNIINGSLNVSPNLASITGANTQTSDNANMSGSRQRSTREEAINRARLISRDRLGSALPSSTSPHRSRSRDHDDVAASAQSPPSIAVARFSPNAPLHYPQNSTSINLPIALRQQSGEAPVADSLDESSPNIGIALHPSRSTSILQLNDEHQQANGQQDDSIIQKGVTSTEHGNHISDINSTLPDTIRDSRYVSDDNAQEKLDESFDVFADTQPDPDADLLDVRILGDTILDMSDDDADSNKFGSNDIFEDEADPSNELGHPDDDVTADQLRENDLHANPIVKKELDYSFLQGKGIQFPESSVLVISIRNALEALSANTFALCGNLCFSSVQNERNNSIDSEATLIGMNLWHKIQVVMGQNFSVLYPDDGTQLSLFRRAVVSPFACASTLPAVSIGALALLESRQTSFKSLFSGSDILASLATVQKYLLMESLVNPEVTVNVNSTCLVQARLYFSRHLFRLLKVVIATLDIEASHAVANNSSPTLKISIDNETLNQIWSSIASCISKEIPQLFQDNMKATDNFSRTFTAVFLPCFDLTINMESVHVIRLLFPHLKTILSTLHSCVCVHPELSTQQSKRFNFVISKFRPLFAFSCSIIDLLQRLTFPSDAAIHEHMLNPNESNVESNKVIPWIEFLRSTKVSSDDEGWISDVLDKLSSGPKIDEVFSLGLLKASLSTSEKMSISNAVQERCKIAALDFTAWLLEIWTCDSAVSDVLNEEWKAQMHLGANMLSPLCSTTSTVSTDYLSIDFGKIIEKFDIQLSERFDIMMGFSKCSQTLIDAFSSHIDGILASQLSLKCSKSSLGFHFLRKCIGLLVAQLQKSPDELSQTIDAADTSPLEQLRGCLDLVIKILKLCPSVLSQEDGLVAEADEVHLRSLLNVISSGLDPLIIYLTDMLNRYQANIKAIYDHNAEVLMSSTKEIFNTSPTVVSSVCAPQGSFALGFWLHIPSSFGSDKSPSSTHLVSRMEEASELNMLSVLKLDGHARCTPTTALDTNGSGECFLSVTWATSPTEVATMSSHEVPLGRDKWVLCIVSAQQSFEKDKFEEKFVHGRKIVSKIIRRPVIDLSLHVDGALQCTKQIHTEQNSCFQSIVIGTVSQLVESKSSIKVADVFWSPMPDVTICGAPLCEQLQQLNQIWECICKTLTLSRHLRLLSPTEDVSFLCNIMKSCLKIVCLGDVVCSEEAFKTLESIVRSIKDETNADIRECLKYILQSLCGLASFLNGNLDSNTSTDGHHLLFDQWSARVNIQSWKLSRPIKTYVDSLNKLRVHETMFMSSVARLLWEAASVGLFDVSSVNNAYQYLSTEKSTENSMTLYPVSFDCITHILLICAGAWPSVPTITRTALVAPRALVLGENAKSQENYAFTEEVNISQVSNGRGLLLGNTVSSCDFGSSWGTTNDTLVPHLTDSVSSTELLLCQNNIDPLLLPSVTNLTQLISVPSSTQLNIYCKAAISKSENKTPLPQSLLPKVMGSLRALMTQAATFHTQQSSNHDALAQILSKNIPNIIAIASLDPLDLFEEMRKSGTLKSAQYDVLKSLLKEGDILFLEKISMKLWNGRFTNSTNIHSATTELESKLTMTVVAGDMQIQGSRVRALVHFPTAKLSDCKIGRRSGRWFYEVLLLSDGLIQIGWASNFFRCDPVSGQGVGDHASSWAYDGMRTKKWNVSCEPYGTLISI